MQTLLELSRAYRAFMVELGQELKRVRDEELYEGFADTYIDLVKSPEIGLTKSESDMLIRISDMFGLLDVDDLPSYHAMKLMVNKKVDMDLLEAANTLSLTDFKELIKDHEIGTQQRTYKYEIIRRVKETGNINRIYAETKEEAISEILKEDFGIDWEKIQQAKDSFSIKSGS